MNAEQYHLNQAQQTGYVTAEALQFVLGPELLKGAVKVGSGLVGMGGAKGVNAIKVGNYTFTNTAAKHLPKRPYMNSPGTIINIMKSGKGVPDATFKGGINYKVPGTFGGSKGVWELGINPETNTIYHFVFKSAKK